jgi:UDP-N-acetylenolpyruvoylglucosamine reductase
VLMLDVDGLVIVDRIGGDIREALRGLPDSSHAKKCVLKVGSGQSLQQLSLATSRLGWSGLEFAAGIPASLGGAPQQHVHITLMF